MAQPQPDMQPLVAAQGQTREQINAQVIAIATAAAAGFTGWYSTEQITAWAARLVKTLDPLLRLLARNTDAYMARAVSGVAGERFRPAGAVDLSQLRTGVTREGAYGRAADVFRYQQSQFDRIARQINTGTIPDPPRLVDPVEAAMQRVIDVADMDTILTVTHQAQATLAEAARRDLVTGWRRVIHPELSIGGSCGLCIASSHRVYGASDLQPVHGRCNCIPTPIKGGNDPGSVLNDKDLTRIYGDAGSVGREDLKRTRYVVTEHGELGPVLSGKKIRTEDGKTRRTVAPKTGAEKAAAVQRIFDSLAEALPKVRDLAHDQPRQWGPYRDNLEQRVAELEKQLLTLAA